MASRINTNLDGLRSLTLQPAPTPPGIRLLWWIVGVWVTIVLLSYTQMVRPFVGGADFFYHLCNARDVAAGSTTLAETHFNYFPGVTNFWTTAIRIVGDSLPRLQWVALGVLWGNAILIAAIVWNHTANRLATFLAVPWYLLMCSRLEGFLGMVEPLATLPYLLGLYFWIGQPLNSSSGLHRPLALGVGLGLTLFTKQQAGLLSLGALTFLLIRPRTSSASRSSWRFLLALPMIAALTFLVGILLQGEGLFPLRQGLLTAGGLTAKGSPLYNVLVIGFYGFTLFLAGLLGWCLWLAALRKGNLYDHIGESNMRMIGFALISGSVPFVQYLSRGYLHYALLCLPGLMIAVLIPLGLWLRHRSNYAPLKPRQHLLIFAVVSVFLLVLSRPGNVSQLVLWRMAYPTDFEPHHVWFLEPEVQADLEALQTQLEKNERLCLLPPRQNAIHFQLQTRSAATTGYWWEAPAAAETIDWTNCDAVLVIHRDSLAVTDVETWNRMDCESIVESLPDRGFTSVWAGNTMTLYRLMVREEE